MLREEILVLVQTRRTVLFNVVEKGPNGPKVIQIKKEFNELAVKLHKVQKQ